MSEHASLRELRVGVVGCGGSRQTYGPALSSLDNVRLTALMDVDIVCARVWSKLLRGCRAYGDFDEFIAEAETDAVIVASPADVRAQHVDALLRAGKHVLVETPMATTASSSMELCNLARLSGMTLMPALPLRYDPALMETQRRLASGDIGDIRELRCEWAYSSAWSERKAVVRSWSAALLRHSIRTLDLARRLMGEAHTVSADIDRPGPHKRGAPLANLIVQHERGVSVHHIHRTSRRARLEQYILTGSEGIIELAAPAVGALDGSSVFFLSYRPAGSGAEETAGPFCDPDRRGSPEHAVHRMLANFVAAARGHEAPAVTGLDAVASQTVFEAALVSSDEGLKLTVTPPARTAIPAA